MKTANIFCITITILYNIMTDLTETEQKTLDEIKKSGSLYQSELSDKIDCSSGQASKVARSLDEKGLIERKKAKNENNRQSYELKIAKKDPKELDFSLLMAGNYMSPFIGEDKIDIHSEQFNQWLMNLPEKGKSQD